MATTTPVPPPLWDFHVRSWPSVAMPRGETGLPVAAVFHLRLTAARAPLPVTDSGDVDVPHGPHCIHRSFSYEVLDPFMDHPRRSMDVVTDLLYNFLDTNSPYRVEVSTFRHWVNEVSYIVSRSALLARQAVSCGVTTHVHICRLLREGESSAVGGGGVIGRALLSSRESYEREGGFGGVPALESAIEALETATYEGRVRKEDCPICLEELVGGQVVKRVPCGHLFHGVCIVDWLGKSHTCPLCRFAMPKRQPGIT